MEVGGAETLVAQMCHLQREGGHDVAVYAVAALGQLGEQLRRSGFPVHANVGRHLADSSLNFLRMFRASRPDVVHLHNPTPTIYAAPAAKLARVPSIISTRHSLVAEPRDLTMERKYRVAALSCNWIVGICDATTKNLLEARSAARRKIVRVYNGTAPVTNVPAQSRIEKDSFTFLFVGRLERVKNLGHLLQALRATVDKLPDVQLWFVGDGTERSRLEQTMLELNLTPNVTFWGRQLDVAPFFSAADAFAMSSVSEGLPMSLLQAFSIGLPAVVTDIGGMGEVVRLANAGFATPVDDVGAMAAAMIRLATTPEERQAFSRTAVAAFERHFTIGQVVENYDQLYRRTGGLQSKVAV